MRRAAISIVLSIVSLVVLQSISATAQTQPEKWEYSFITNCNSKEVYKLGEEGWELVSVIQIAGCPTYYFKRPKREVFYPTAPGPPTGPPTCNLTLAQAPVFRGIRIGMSTDELLALFPRSKEQSEIIRALSKAEANYGVVDLDFKSHEFPENKQMFDNNISIYAIRLFDGRIVRIYVSYAFPTGPYYKSPNWTAKTWITKLSQAYNIPGAEEWKVSYGFNAVITCQGFRLSVYANGNSASIELIGPLTIDDQIKQRNEAAAEKLRSEFKP